MILKMTFKIYKNGIIHNNSSWDKSGKLYIDESASTFTQGETILIERNEKQDKLTLTPNSTVKNHLFSIFPGDIITITSVSDNTSNIVNVLIDWLESY